MKPAFKDIATEFQSHRQKTFGMSRPVRDYQKLIPPQVANTGLNPSGKYLEFMNKDLVHPLVKDRTTIYTTTAPNFASRKEKWALEYTVNCSNENYLPKVQQFKSYNFVNRSNSESEKYRNTFLKTDNIAIRVPKMCSSTNKSQGNTEKKFSFLELKNRYNITSESGSSWAPMKYDKSISNNSSVNYNILTFQQRGKTKDLSNILNKKIANKKKSMAEYNDLTGTFAVNYSKKFEDAFKENNKRFCHFNGIFTHLYDAAARNGNLIMPFRKNNYPFKKNN